MLAVLNLTESAIANAPRKSHYEPQQPRRIPKWRALRRSDLTQIRHHQFLLMLRRLLPLVGNRPFGRWHANAKPRKPSRFLVHAQPVFLLLGHDRCHRNYHKSPSACAIYKTHALPDCRDFAPSPSHPIPPALRPKPRNVTLPKHDSRLHKFTSCRSHFAVADHARRARPSPRLHVAIPKHSSAPGHQRNSLSF